MLWINIYLSFPSASMNNRILNIAGEHHWSTRPTSC